MRGWRTSKGDHVEETQTPQSRKAKLERLSSDITKRTKAEALRRSKENWENTLNTISDWVVLTDLEGRILHTNRAGQDFTGLPLPKIVGQACCRLVHGSDKHVAGYPMVRMLETGQRETTELQDPSTGHWLMVTVDPVTDEQGNLVAAVHITRDITERKKAEEEIKKIFNMTGYMICVADIDGYFKRINSSFEQTLGYSSEELLSKPFLDFVHPEDRQKTMLVIKEKLSSGIQVIGFENRYRCKDGSYKWLSWTSRPVAEEGLVYAIAYDVTERKKVEQEVLDYQAKLKSLASELLLTEERERRRIATGVHDQIGQQLALLKLELQSLGTTVSDTGACSSLDKACELTDQIIADSRSLTFELSNPVLYEVGLDKAVESWLGRYVPRESKLKYKVISKPSPLKPDTQTSVVLFGVIRELLTNVVKHGDANTVQVRIQESSRTVRVSIEDDGVGFESSRLDSPTKKAGGFGLFNARERVEYLGGRFEIESKLGQGTCVRISVPAKREVSC